MFKDYIPIAEGYALTALITTRQIVPESRWLRGRVGQTRWALYFIDLSRSVLIYAGVGGMPSPWKHATDITATAVFLKLDFDVRKLLFSLTNLLKKIY